MGGEPPIRSTYKPEGAPKSQKPPYTDTFAATAQSARRFAVRSGSRYLVFPLADVSSIVSRDHYAEISCGDERALADESLDAPETRLDPERFVRIHRSAIVNLTFLKELRREGDRRYTAVLLDHTEISVARDRLDALLARLKL